MLSLINRNIHNLLSDKRFSEILTGSVWALGARVIITGVGLLNTIIIARFYGTDVLGIVSVLNSFLMIATILTVLGTDTSILRLIPEHITNYSPTSAFKIYRKTQLLVFIASLIIATIFFIFSDVIAETVFSKPYFSYYFSIASFFIIFKSIMMLNIQSLRGIKLVKSFAFMQSLPHAIMLVILLTSGIFSFHPDNPIFAMLAAFPITALVGAIIMERSFKNRIGPNDHFKHMSMLNIVSLSLPMLMTTAMSFIIGQTGVIMLGMFRQENEVGCYAVAVKMATLTRFILSAINAIAAPKFSELFHTGQMDELLRVAKKTSKLTFWVCTPILLSLIIFGKHILNIIFGSNLGIAYTAMVFIIIGQLINSIAGSTGFFMNMTNSHYAFRNIMVFSSIFNIGCNLLLIPYYGINGAAISAMISTILWNSMILIFVQRKFGKSIGYFPSIFDICKW